MPFLKGAGALIARARRAEGRDRDAIFGIGLRGSPWTRSGRHDIRAAAAAHAFDQGEPLKRFLPRLAPGASRAGVTTAGNEPSRPVPMSFAVLVRRARGGGGGRGRDIAEWSRPSAPQRTPPEPCRPCHGPRRTYRLAHAGPAAWPEGLRGRSSKRCRSSAWSKTNLPQSEIGTYFFMPLTIAPTTPVAPPPTSCPARVPISRPPAESAGMSALRIEPPPAPPSAPNRRSYSKAVLDSCS
jgi:hypothetical protein